MSRSLRAWHPLRVSGPIQDGLGLETTPRDNWILPNTTFPNVINAGFSAGLIPVRSPLLRKSWLVSFPPLSNMLKFSGWSRLLWGRRMNFIILIFFSNYQVKCVALKNLDRSTKNIQTGRSNWKIFFFTTYYEFIIDRSARKRLRDSTRRSVREKFSLLSMIADPLFQNIFLSSSKFQMKRKKKRKKFFFHLKRRDKRQSFEKRCQSSTNAQLIRSHRHRKDIDTSSLVLFVERPSARRGPGDISVDRNVRSKCRCSCVLQFTSWRAISCVLHRSTSQVIHRSG